MHSSKRTPLNVWVLVAELGAKYLFLQYPASPTPPPPAASPLSSQRCDVPLKHNRKTKQEGPADPQANPTLHSESRPVFFVQKFYPGWEWARTCKYFDILKSPPCPFRLGFLWQGCKLSTGNWKYSTLRKELVTDGWRCSFDSPKRMHRHGKDEICSALLVYSGFNRVVVWVQAWWKSSRGRQVREATSSELTSLQFLQWYCQLVHPYYKHKTFKHFIELVLILPWYSTFFISKTY